MRSNEEVEDIKRGILYSLDKRGVLDNLKAHLRSDLYNKLKKSEDDVDLINNRKYVTNNFIKKENDSIKNINMNHSKLNKMTLSLISDYLKKNNMNYSLSVFLHECKSLLSDEIYTESEISKICDIDYTSLNKDQEVSFLNYFVKNRIINFKLKDRNESSTQTESCTDSTDSTLEEKLKQIDLKYSNNINLESLMPAKSLEEKMIKYQREQEIRFNDDLEREIRRFKDVELSVMRIEENRKYMKKLDDLREEFEKEYSEKFESLKKRDSESSMRISYREKELETQLYENRQKFLNELQSVKIREEELKRKFENDFNNLKLEEDKMKFKSQELEYTKEKTIKKYKEEIEQFKLEYDRKFELERNEFRNKKLDLEEKEFKNNLFIDKLNSFENQNILMKEEKENLSNEIKKLEKINIQLSKDNELLREELKIISTNEKRNSDLFSRKEIETHHLKEENRLIRETLEEQKKLTEERRKDQSVLLENMKSQLDENLERLEKNKNYYENEIDSIKKNHNKILNRERDSNEEIVEELEKRNRKLEDELRRFKEINNQNKKREIDSHNFNNTNKQNFYSTQNYPNGIRMNNYFNNLNDIKTSDRLMNWSKLEKEAEDLKNEFKRSFIQSSRRDENKSKQINIDQVYLDMYDRINNDKVNMIKNQIKMEQMKANNSTTNNINLNENKNNINNEIISKPIENIQNNIKEYIIVNQEEESKNIIYSEKLKENEIINDKVQEINNKLIDPPNVINIHQPILHNPQVLSEEKEDYNKAKESLENELNKMKEEYSKKLESDKLPTPLIIGINNAASMSLRSKEFDNSNNDFSVANLTSSNEWDLDTNRKENKNINGLYNVTPLIEPKVIPIIEEINNNSIIEIKENNSNINNLTLQSNKNKTQNNSIKEESEESRNLSNLIDNVIKDKNSESNIDYSKSYNKFSNVNYDVDKNEIEEDIKIEGESDNYDYDFVEDVDNLEKKMSVDLDAIKNISMNFNNSQKNLNNTKSQFIKSQSIDIQIEKFLGQSKTSQNIEDNISEDIQLETSKREKDIAANSNTIEEDSALKYNDYYQSANFNLIAASSSNNNLIKNVIKDTSARDKESFKLYESRNSDIKEDIIQDEDDGFEPINYEEI